MPYNDTPIAPVNPASQVDWNHAFSDFDGWAKTLPNDQQQALTDRFKYSTDPAADKQRFLSVGYVASQANRDVSEVSDKFDSLYMPAFAQDRTVGLGLTDAPKDVGQFFASAKERLASQKAESDLLQTGPDSLLARANTAGIDGKDYTQAFADWQQQAADADGYDTTKSDAYHRAGRLQYEDALQRGNYGEVGKIADRALSLIEGAQSMTKDGKSVAPDMSLEDRTKLVQDLADYSPEARRHVYEVIAQKAQAQGLDPKSAFRGIDSAMRGFDTIVNGASQAGVRAMSAIPGVVNDQALDSARESVGKQQAVYGELTQLANGVVDPIKSKGWLSTASNSLGGLVPFVATGSFGLAGTAAMLGGISNDVSNQVKYANPGMSQGAADSIGVISGTAQTLLMGKMGEWLTESAPGVSQFLAKYTAPNLSAATRYGAHFAGQAVSQGLTFGVALPLATPIAQGLVSTVNSTVPGVHWGEETTKMFEALPESIAPVLVLSLIGAHAGTVHDYDMAKGFVGNPEALKALGFNDAQAAKIRSAPDQVAALRGEYPNRPNDAPSMMAGAKAYSDQVKAGQVATKTLEERGVLPVIAHTDGNQWTITTKDGGAAHFPDWDSANAARWQHVEDNRMSVDDTTRALLDHFSKGLDVGTGHGVEFSPEAPTARDMADAGTPEADLLRRVDQSQLLDGGKSEDDAFSKASAVGEAAAQTPEDRLANQRILGSSSTEFRDGVLVTTSKLYQGATPLTVIEEKVHGDVSAMISTPAGRQWAIDKLRGYEQASGDNVLLSKDNAAVKDSDIQEAWASLAQGYLVRAAARRPGLVESWKAKGFRQAFRELLRSPVGPEMNAYAELFGAAARRAAQLAKLKREGKLDSGLEAALAKHLGLESAMQHESGVDKAAQEIRDGMGETGAETYHPPEGEAFSMMRAKPADTSNQTELPDGSKLVGPTSFSMLAYHGTPHEVDKFSTDKIGTGEGAQAYGWGLYFAQSKQVGEMYRDTLADVQREKIAKIRALISDNKAGINAAMERLSDPANRWAKIDTKAVAEKEAANAGYLAEIQNLEGFKGNLYTVHLLPDESHFLDWDKPLSEQSDKVKAVIATEFPRLDQVLPSWMEHDVKTGEPTGADLYQMFVNRKTGDTEAIQKSASEMLAEAGIPGIKYFDGNSRMVQDWKITPASETVSGKWMVKSSNYNSKGLHFDTEQEAKTALAAKLAEQTRNFVIFDHDLVKILEKNGKPVGSKSDASFSLAPGMVDARIARMFSPFMHTPEARMELGKEMQRRARDAAKPWIEASEATRSAKAIRSERDVREATLYADKMAAAEAGFDHDALHLPAETRIASEHPVIDALVSRNGGKLSGRLMSESEARRQGKAKGGEYDGKPSLPPWMYGGTLAPDQAAQQLFDSHLISEPTPDAMWKAVESAMQSASTNKDAFNRAQSEVKAAATTARAEAKAEAGAWYDNAVINTGKVALERGKIAASIRMLDAITRALPAELRGKIGGASKLASLGTDEARLVEIERRAVKIDTVVENWMKKDLHSQLGELIDAAQGKGGKGEKATGTIGVEGHRLFAEMDSLRDLTQDQVDERREGILDAFDTTDSHDFAKLADLSERLQMLEAFGNIAGKGAADLSKSLELARSIHDTGKNKWRTQEEARLGVVHDLQTAIIKNAGKTGTPAELIASKEASKGPWSKAKSAAGEFLSFTQVLEGVFGRTAEVTKRWHEHNLSAAVEKQQGINDAHRDFRDLLAKVYGDKVSALERGRKVWALRTERSISVNKPEGRHVETMEIPIDKAQDILSGKVAPETFGLNSGHLDTLQNAVDVWSLTDATDKKSVDRKQSVSLDVTRHAGELSKTNLTPMEAVYLTQLGRQKRYAKALERSGWTPEVMAEIESQLPADARALRQWMQDRYAAGYDGINDVHKRMYGIDLAQEENYAPARFEHDTIEAAPDAYGGGVQQEGGLATGFLRRRKDHQAAPVLADALTNFFQHTAQVEHFKAYAELSREMNGVLRASPVRLAVQAAKGTKAFDLARNWATAIDQGGIRAKSAAPMLDNLARWISSGQAYVGLAWNVGTMMKHYLSVFSAASKMPTWEYAKRFALLHAGQLEVRPIWNADFIQSRLEGGVSPEQKAAMAKSFESAPSRRQLFLEMGTHALGYVDTLATTGGAAIAYDYHLSEAKRAGLSDEQAHSAAMRETEDMVARTSYPADMTQRSLAELNAGPIGKLLWLFATPGRQKAGLFATAVHQVMKGEASKTELARVMLVTHLIGGIVAQGMSSGWRAAKDKDKDFFDPSHWHARDFIIAGMAGPLAELPFLRELTSHLKGESARGPLDSLWNGGKSAVKLGQAAAGKLSDHDRANKAKDPFHWYASKATDALNLAGVLMGHGMESLGVGSRLVKDATSIGENIADE